MTLLSDRELARPSRRWVALLAGAALALAACSGDDARTGSGGSPGPVGPPGQPPAGGGVPISSASSIKASIVSASVPDDGKPVIEVRLENEAGQPLNGLCCRQHQLRAGTARARRQRQVEHLARDHAPHRGLPGTPAPVPASAVTGTGPTNQATTEPATRGPVGRGQPGNGIYTYTFAQSLQGHQRHSLRRVARRTASASRSASAAARDGVHPGQQRRLHLDARDGRRGRIRPRDRRQRHLQRLPRPARVPRRRALRPAVLRDVPRVVLVRRADRQHDRSQGDDPQDPPRQAADRPVRDLRLQQRLLRLLAHPVHAGPAQLPDLPRGERHRHAAGQQLAPHGESRGLRLVPQRGELRHRRRPRRRRGDGRPVRDAATARPRTSACGPTRCTSTRCCAPARSSGTRCSRSSTAARARSPP